MREDMAKVLVERPRVRSRFVRGRPGKSYTSRIRKEMHSEDGSPARESTMARYNHIGDKHFNEHLGPLRRYLHSQVGRPWTKIYSEICERVDRGNVVQNHILTHLFQYVVLEAQILDGQAYAAPHIRSGRYGAKPLRGPDQWYVCPNTGLLKRAKTAKRRERHWYKVSLPKHRPIGWVDSTHFVRANDDGGYELVTVRPWPEEAIFYRSLDRYRDIVFGKSLAVVDVNVLCQYYGRKVYAVAIRTLQTAELRDLPITLPNKLRLPNVVR
ncbi:MAG: hypothetical protein ACRC8S_20500 [Fimbriiglobus sp.]